MRALFVALADLVPELFGRFERVFADHEQRIRGEIVEQGFGCAERAVLEEHRQVVLDPGRRRAFPDVLVQRAAARVDRETLAQAVAECAHRLLGERELARRQQAHRFDLGRRALGFRIEAANRFDVLVEQLDAERLGRAHREHVEDRAAHREVTRFQDLRHVAVAGRLEAALLGAKIETLAAFEHETGARDVGARSEALHQGRGRHHEDAAAQRGQSVQGRDALRHDFRMRGEQVPRQGFPVRKVQDLEVRRREYGEFAFQRVGRVGITGDRDDHAGVASAGFGQRERQRRAVRRKPGASLGRRRWQRGRQHWFHRFRKRVQRRTPGAARAGARSLAGR